MNEQKYSLCWSWRAVCYHKWHHPSWEEHLQTVSSLESLELWFSSVAPRLWLLSQVWLRLFVLPVTVLAVMTGISSDGCSTEEHFSGFTRLTWYEFSVTALFLCLCPIDERFSLKSSLASSFKSCVISIQVKDLFFASLSQILLFRCICIGSTPEWTIFQRWKINVF